MTEPLDDPECLGICVADPDSGYCMGCGRPIQAPEVRVDDDSEQLPGNSVPADSAATKSS